MSRGDREVVEAPLKAGADVSGAPRNDMLHVAAALAPVICTRPARAPALGMPTACRPLTLPGYRPTSHSAPCSNDAAFCAEGGPGIEAIASLTRPWLPLTSAAGLSRIC